MSPTLREAIATRSAIIPYNDGMNLRNRSLTGEMTPKSRIFEGILALAIIGIIAAIVFPVYSGKPFSTKGGCISRLKQCALAVIMYASDNNDVYPAAFTFDGPKTTESFIGFVSPYLKLDAYPNQSSVLRCPAEGHLPEPNPEGFSDKMTYVHSLALRAIIPEFSNGNRILKVSEPKEPAKTAYLRDPIRGYGKPKGENATNAQPSTGFLSTHPSGFTIGYIDGHVKTSRELDEFTQL